MIKEELEELIYDAQNAGRGCGCCEDDRDRTEGRKDVVEKIWAEFLLLHKVIEKGKF